MSFFSQLIKVEFDKEKFYMSQKVIVGGVC